MVRSSKFYLCIHCGAQSHQFFGRCPECTKWNSLIEQTQTSLINNDSKTLAKLDSTGFVKRSEDITQMEELSIERIESGYEELNRVLGGGLVPGSLVLVGGDPGIGKSTLLLQSAMIMCQHSCILYVTAEESAQQVKLRWNRLRRFHCKPLSISDENNRGLYLLEDTELELVIQEVELIRPAIVIIDSLQALYSTTLSGIPGSISQIRECTTLLQKIARRQSITFIIVGHITKDGTLAGPKILEHLVDVVLTFEGDRFASYRILRAVKNRFGATNELGVFEMHNHGLKEVHNPFELFLGNSGPTPGVSKIVTYKGTRPLIVELQALVNTSEYLSPRRTVTGIKINRLHQILAVLGKKMNLPFSKCDCYLAVAGGLKVEEPGADLGIAVAIVASYREITLPPYTAFIGELGLGGNLRPVSQLRLRLQECARLGFQHVVVPKGNEFQSMGDNLNLQIIEANTVPDALMMVLQL